MIKKTDQKDLFQTGPGSFIFDRTKMEIDRYKDLVKRMEDRDNTVHSVICELQNTKDKINKIEDDLHDIKLLLTQLCRGK